MLFQTFFESGALPVETAYAIARSTKANAKGAGANRAGRERGFVVSGACYEPRFF